jgi:hypothetical protein
MSCLSRTDMVASFRTSLNLYVVSFPDATNTRGLLFCCKGLQKLQSDRSAILRDCFKESYDIVLRHHYTFLMHAPAAVSATSLCTPQQCAKLHSNSGGFTGRPYQGRILQTYGPRMFDRGTGGTLECLARGFGCNN